MDRDRVDALAESGDRRARVAAASLRRLSFHLSAAQLGITITSLVLGFIAEPTVAGALEPIVRVPAVAVVLALVLVTVVTMVVGELIPKRMSIARPLPSLLRVGRVLQIYAALLAPLIRTLNGAADWAVRRVGIEPREELRSVRTMEELELLIRSSGEQGTLEPEAFELLTRTIRFAHKSASDALVPRVDMEVLPRDATVRDLVHASVETGFSRFPVIGDDLDDILGVAHVKDALRIAPEDRATAPVVDLVVDALVVPAGLDLEALLTTMRERGSQMAIVADEHGGVDGIVTLEDLLEEIVGDIEDEHDQPQPAPMVTLPEGVHELEGTTHLDDVLEATGLELPEGPYETLAGFILEQLGHIPATGERVAFAGWDLEVTEMDRQRIAAVRLTEPRGSA
ncbi:MAG: magnesium and cobalt exporter, family [Actinomycetota bacterium]|nr:magnesium and cobalt exporter, family [Actinomycetota bacterium]